MTRCETAKRMLEYVPPRAHNDALAATRAWTEWARTIPAL